MRTEQERQQKNGGFTLVEMIVAVAITAVFSAVVLTGGCSRLKIIQEYFRQHQSADGHPGAYR